MSVALGLVALLESAGCVAVDGGAVEFSWSLRTFEGDVIRRCAHANIERVRLCWSFLEEDGAAGGCRPQDSKEFDCVDQTGTTGFELPPGRTSLLIQPICLDGAPALEGTYDVPPPIVRTVEDGKVVTLGSLLIVATDATKPEESRCPPSGCTCAASAANSPHP